MGIKNKIRGFLGKFINVAKLGDEDNIFEKGLVNSLFAVQLVNFIENEFDMTIENDDMDMANFRSVNAIYDLINRRK